MPDNTFTVSDSRELFKGEHPRSKWHLVESAKTVDDAITYTAPCGTTGIESDVEWAQRADEIELGDICKECAEAIHARQSEAKSRPDPISLGAHLSAQKAKQADLEEREQGHGLTSVEMNTKARTDRRVQALEARIAKEGPDANA